MQNRVWGLMVVALLAGACTAARAQESTPPPTAEASMSDSPHVAAVGDMVCNRDPKEGPNRNLDVWGTCEAMAVSQLVLDGDYDRFFALGDLQYLRGSAEKFRKYYDPTYGRVKDITIPVAGNHEYYTRTDGEWGAGYYDYFGAAAHPPHGYYSMDLGDWHVIVLNTQLCKEKSWLPRFGMVHGLPGDGCKAGDPQYEWLRRDLAAHPNSEYPCTLAVYHHPLFKWTQWAIRKSDRVQRPLWRLLRTGGADLVLNGHQHNYQRFEPLNTKGELSDKGMAEIVVGTGGDTYGPFPPGGKEVWDGQPVPSGLVARAGTTYGILDLTLDPTSYSWEFVPLPGDTPFQDSGSADCR